MRNVLRPFHGTVVRATLAPRPGPRREHRPRGRLPDRFRRHMHNVLHDEHFDGTATRAPAARQAAATLATAHAQRDPTPPQGELRPRQAAGRRWRPGGTSGQAGGSSQCDSRAHGGGIPPGGASRSPPPAGAACHQRGRDDVDREAGAVSSTGEDQNGEGQDDKDSKRQRLGSVAGCEAPGCELREPPQLQQVAPAPDATASCGVPGCEPREPPAPAPAAAAAPGCELREPLAPAPVAAAGCEDPGCEPREPMAPAPVLIAGCGVPGCEPREPMAPAPAAGAPGCELREPLAPAPVAAAGCGEPGCEPREPLAPAPASSTSCELRDAGHGLQQRRLPRVATAGLLFTNNNFPEDAKNELVEIL